MVVAAPSMAHACSHVAALSASSTTATSSRTRPSISALRSSGPGLISRIGCTTSSSVHAGFAGNVSGFSLRSTCSSSSNSRVSMQTGKVKPSIQFIRGVEERVVPDVKLTRSRDGTNGVALFVFDNPSVFDSSRELGDITGLYMCDEEGTLSTVEVSAKFLNGKPSKIEGQYVMRNTKEWDRFMRFMERYAEENQLGFVKS